MATKKYDAVATIRYTHNGEEKKRFHNMGAVFESEKGMSLKLESIPVGFDGWVTFYTPKPKEEAPKAAAPADDSEIPF